MFAVELCSLERAFAADDDEIDFSNEEVTTETDSSFDESNEFDDEFNDEFSENETSDKTKEEIKSEAKAEPEAEPQPEQVVESEKVAEPENAADPENVVEPVQEELKAVEPEPQQELLPEPKVEETQIAETPMPDDPNLSYEAQLHDIFKKYHSSKTPTEEWDTIIKYRPSEKYEIRSGDSLWSISKTIFGDGEYWPKVWSLNSQIQNPHLISPQNNIRFLLGDELNPPSFTVTENAANSVEASYSKSDGSEAEPDIPPSRRTSRPVVKRLPPSLPIWQDVSFQGNFDQLGIDYAHRKILDIEDTIPLPSYISEAPLVSYGQVREIEVGANLASSYQYVYVSIKNGSGQIGDTFLAVADRGRVQSVNETIKGFLGYTIDILGEVQLVERVTLKKEIHDQEMFRALVLKIINPVSVGALLTIGKIEKIKISDQGPRSQIVAQIIGGSYFNRRQVYGDESIAYLNKGSSDGLEVGQVLPIRANRTVRNVNSNIDSNVKPIGWLRVVRVTPHFATTVIVKSWSDILTGDLTGIGGAGTNISSRLNSGDSEVEEFSEADDSSEADEEFDSE